MIENERLSFEADSGDYEFTLFQALVNEGKHIRVLNSKRPQFSYNEKQLRDAAAAEVMLQLGGGNDLEDDDGKSSNRKRKNLNPDEKVKQSRDRNREHAKNTRLRKKAYVTKLKELVDQMTRQKEMEERDRRVLGEKIHDTQVIRRNTVRLFMAYRSACVTDPNKWTKIVDENISFTLPITPYRPFCRAEIENNTRVVVGIDGLIADCCSLALMTETIGINSEEWNAALLRGEGCTLNYDSLIASSQDNMLAAGELVMCQYTLKTEHSNSVSFDNNESCIQYGMLQCRFNRRHKIVAAEIMYDVMGFMQQLQKASAISPENSILPNTVDMAIQPSNEARAILRVDGQYSFLHVNNEWTKVTGISQAAIEGVPFQSIFTPHRAFQEQCKRLVEECAIKGRAGSRVMYFQIADSPLQATKSDTGKGHHLAYVRMLPLTTYSEKTPSYILMILLPLDMPGKEEEENLIHRHCIITGSTVISNNIKHREGLDVLNAYDVELSRQLVAFQNHYAAPAQGTAPMGLTSMDLLYGNLGSTGNMNNQMGYNAYPAGAPLQKSFMYQNNNTNTNAPHPAQIAEPQFSPYFSTIPSNLQSLPVVHHLPYGMNPNDVDMDPSKGQGSLRGQVQNIPVPQNAAAYMAPGMMPYSNIPPSYVQHQSSSHMNDMGGRGNTYTSIDRGVASTNKAVTVPTIPYAHAQQIMSDRVEDVTAEREVSTLLNMRTTYQSSIKYQSRPGSYNPNDQDPSYGPSSKDGKTSFASV